MGEITDESPGTVKAINGHKKVSQIVLVDQSPLSKNPRSTPVVYVGAFEFIRKLFAEIHEVKEAGHLPGFLVLILEWAVVVGVGGTVLRKWRCSSFLISMLNVLNARGKGILLKSYNSSYEGNLFMKFSNSRWIQRLYFLDQ